MVSHCWCVCVFFKGLLQFLHHFSNYLVLDSCFSTSLKRKDRLLNVGSVHKNLLGGGGGLTTEKLSII